MIYLNEYCKNILWRHSEQIVMYEPDIKTPAVIVAKLISNDSNWRRSEKHWSSCSQFICSKSFWRRKLWKRVQINIKRFYSKTCQCYASPTYLWKQEFNILSVYETDGFIDLLYSRCPRNFVWFICIRKARSVSSGKVLPKNILYFKAFSLWMAKINQNCRIMLLVWVE